jgi:acetyl esterase/lipase
VSLLPHPALHVRVAVMRAVIRRAGPDKALLRAARLRPCVPPGIASRLDLPYDRGDGDPMLDVFRPRDTGTDTGTPRPVIVWVHGGGWIGGSRNEMREYLQFLDPHEYHLDLHTDAARQALERTLPHLDRHTQPSNRASTMPSNGPSRSSQ